MAEKLSQHEIDALLGGTGDALAAANVGYSVGSDVQLYDFRRPRHVSKERLRTLEAMYERLTKSLEAWLIGRVRRQIELKLQSVEQFTFGEFTLSLPTPCASYGFDIVNVPGQKGVIDIGHEFAYFLVDRFFGGSDNPALMQRAMTPIERLAVRLVVERISGLLAEIWQDFVELDLAITTFESFPEMVQGTGREDPVLVANIEVAFGNLTSLLVLSLPLSVLDKFFSSTDQNRVKEMTGSESERRHTREVAESQLRATNVAVSARLPLFRVPMRQLLGLPIGSVIATGIPTDSPLEIHVGGQPRYRAAAGRVGKKLAVRLLDAPELPATTR
ncbi:MAG: FliM/FliN family flagellar motor switch protein [Gemmatimonadetes bacterium]|nr:FliM/FliN family flagellar motor switch protein [Gemmatimonadota bacterium]MBI3568660.1 FliM/FliN family flagellar motor switch protein [Gemmatimonadota bacterium]